MEKLCNEKLSSYCLFAHHSLLQNSGGTPSARPCLPSVRKPLSIIGIRSAKFSQVFASFCLCLIFVGVVSQLAFSQVPGSSLESHQFRDVGAAVRFGTPGIGLEVSKLLRDHFGVRVGANYFKLSTTKDQSDISYDATLKFQAFTALFDLFPGRRSSFHLTTGIMTDPAKVSGTGQPSGSGTFTINEHSYTAAQVGTLIGEAKFPSVAPYVGIGWGTAARKSSALEFLFDLGVAIGNVSISLTATGAANNPTLASDLRAEEKKTQHDIDKFVKVFPVLSFGLAYRF